VRRHETTVAVRGPWSLATSRAFWEGFSPSALRATDGDALRTVFRVERDWNRAAVEVVQQGDEARVVVTGDGDLDAAAAQACRFPSER
jgi:DNA-3-methyladenine glycosylase II